MADTNDKGAKIKKASEEAVFRACRNMQKCFNFEKRCIYQTWSELAKRLGLSEGDIKALKIHVQSQGYQGPKR